MFNDSAVFISTLNGKVSKKNFATQTFQEEICQMSCFVDKHGTLQKIVGKVSIMFVTSIELLYRTIQYILVNIWKMHFGTNFMPILLSNDQKKYCYSLQEIRGDPNLITKIIILDILWVYNYDLEKKQ